MFAPKRVNPPTVEYSRADLPGPTLRPPAFISIAVDDVDDEIISADSIPALFRKLRLEAEAGAP
jgi:hypothetical protein